MTKAQQELEAVHGQAKLGEPCRNVGSRIVLLLQGEEIGGCAAERAQDGGIHIRHIRQSMRGKEGLDLGGARAPEIIGRVSGDGIDEIRGADEIRIDDGSAAAQSQGGVPFGARIGIAAPQRKRRLSRAPVDEPLRGLLGRPGWVETLLSLGAGEDAVERKPVCGIRLVEWVGVCIHGADAHELIEIADRHEKRLLNR